MDVPIPAIVWRVLISESTSAVKLPSSASKVRSTPCAPAEMPGDLGTIWSPAAEKLRLGLGATDRVLIPKIPKGPRPDARFHSPSSGFHLSTEPLPRRHQAASPSHSIASRSPLPGGRSGRHSNFLGSLIFLRNIRSPAAPISQSSAASNL